MDVLSYFILELWKKKRFVLSDRFKSMVSSRSKKIGLALEMLMEEWREDVNGGEIWKKEA